MGEKCYRFRTRWADVDMNGHMRHTAYNDYGAHTRIMYFEDMNISFQKLLALGIGPVVFKENTNFYKELKLNQEFEVGFMLSKMRKDASKWSIRHNIYTLEHHLAATIELDGAWLDLKKRKTIIPPTSLSTQLMNSARSDDFEWIPDKI